MTPSAEHPPIGPGKSTPERELEITRRWYNDTSFEGRTRAEFKALQEELRKAIVLDFDRYDKDRDYENLIDQNPHVQKFIADMTSYNLLQIRDRRKEIGLSDEQFNKLLSIFDNEVQSSVRSFVAQSEAMRDLYKIFSPAEVNKLSDDNLGLMEKEIELQEKNVPHKRLRLSPFPKEEHQ